MTAAAPDAAHSLRGPVLFWALLAMVALAYLATLALNPDLIAPERRGETAAVTSSGRPASATPPGEELQALRETVVQLKAEIATMKATAPGSDEQERATALRPTLTERATSEPRAPVVTGSLPTVENVAAEGTTASQPAPGTDRRATAPPAASPVIAPADDAPSPAAPAKSTATRKVPAAPPSETAAASAKAPAKKSPAPAATTASTEPLGSFAASVTPAPPNPAPPVSPTIISRANSYGVQLASGPTVDTLRVSWNLLNERHKGVLKGLEPRYATPDDPTAAMALVAGPLATAEEAARVCSNLRAKRITCAVVSFDGKAL